MHSLHFNSFFDIINAFKISVKAMDGHLLNKLMEWMPVLAIIGGLARWIFQLKDEVKNAHDRIDDLENRQTRFEDKIDVAMKEINRRIDDCKDSILRSVNTVLHAISKN